MKRRQLTFTLGLISEPISIGLTIWRSLWGHRNIFGAPVQPVDIWAETSSMSPSVCSHGNDYLHSNWD